MKRAFVLTIAVALLAAPAFAASPFLTVTDIWSRPAVETGVVYLKIRNRGKVADRLLGASSPVASHVELHETTNAAGMGGMMNMGSPMPAMGAMQMRPVREIVIPAGGTVILRPGGYHVMLIGLQHKLSPGERFPLRLRFARAGWVSVTSQVRAM